jgi:hypothetical protein
MLLTVKPEPLANDPETIAAFHSGAVCERYITALYLAIQVSICKRNLCPASKGSTYIT